MPDDGELPLVRREPRTLSSSFPILTWLPRYQWRRDVAPDVVAGLTLAALLIPESMGYAGVAGVPVEVGLYAALGAVLAYAVTGGVSVLVVGPAAAVAALSASLVADMSGDADPVMLTSALAITSGVLLIVAGLLRLGWIVNFISRPVLHAFVAGLCISIIVGQLDGLVGVEVEGESAVAKLVDVLRQVGDWQELTVLLGVGSVATLLVLERRVPRIPAALVVVAVGILVVVALDVDAAGVAVVGTIPSGLPDVAVPDISGLDVVELVIGGLALLLVGFSEGYAAAATVCDRTGEEVHPDQELVGSGAANVTSGLLGGLAVGGSLSKSAAALSAGSRTQMANLVAGALVLATLLFLAPVFERLPEPVLAAIVIVAVLGSADPRRVIRLWDVNRGDFAAGLTTFTLVLVWETLPAMVVGVVLSLLFVVHRATFPDVVELRESRGVFRRVVGTHAEPLTVPADRVAILRHEAPLVYANADRLRRAAGTLAEESPGIVRLVLDAEMLSDLDTTGAELLETIDDDMRRRGIELHLARVHHRAREQIARSRLRVRFEGRTHPDVRSAVDI